MRTIILHHDLEWSEKEFANYLKKKNIKVFFKDIRETDLEEIINLEPDLILNRVYASVANRDYSAIPKTLELLKKLDGKFKVVNNYDASRIDYSKYYAYQKMSEAKIYTPKTWLLNNFKENTFPVVVKRDTGGRAKDLKIAFNKKDLNDAVKKIRKDVQYKGDIIVQEFVKSIKDYDFRIGLFGNDFLYGHKRTLIENGTNYKWMASISKGSKVLNLESRDSELIDFAKKVNEIVGIKFNVLDIIETEKGYCVIENNPTPNYGVHWNNQKINPINMYINGLLKEC